MMLEFCFVSSIIFIFIGKDDADRKYAVQTSIFFLVYHQICNIFSEQHNSNRSHRINILSDVLKTDHARVILASSI